MKKILVALLAFVSLSAFAADEWILITNNKENTYKVEGKKGSFVELDTSGSIITRSTQKGQNPKYAVVFMKKTDCNAGIGKVYFFNTSYEFQFSSDYVKDGRTLGQDTGDLICSLLAKSNT